MTTPRVETSAEEPFVVDWDVELGSGGVAVVLLGHSRASAHAIAVKVMRAELLSTSLAVTVAGRFTREAQISVGLTHPNVVATRLSTRIDGRPALLLDLVGPAVRSLRDSIVGDWDVLRCIARDGACALGYLASEGVVHRDISGGNLLVDPRGRTRLGDFGHATRYDGLISPAGAYGGTWPYISPERLAGERGTTATDIFGLGAVLFELAVGRVPFGDDRDAVTAALPGGAPRLPAGVPRDLRTVIRGMLELDPRRRLTAAEIEALLAPESEAARDRLGALARTWFQARCPQVEHPTDRVRMFGGEAVGPEPDRRLVRSRSSWIVKSVAAAVVAAGAALLVWLVWSPRPPAVVQVAESTQAGDSSREPSRVVSIENGPNRAAMRAERIERDVAALSEAIKRHGPSVKTLNLATGTLMLFPGEWHGDKLALQYHMSGESKLTAVHGVRESGNRAEFELSENTIWVLKAHPGEDLYLRLYESGSERPFALVVRAPKQ